MLLNTTALYIPVETRMGTTSNYTSVETDGDVVFVGGGGLSFGELSVESNAVETAIATAGTAVQVTVFDTNGESNGNVTPDHTNDHITVGVAGRYLITISVTINSVGGIGSVVEMTCKKNNGASSILVHMDRNLAGGGGESGCASLSGIADLAANDTVEFWVENETNTQNYVIEDCQMSVVQIGGTT